MCHQLVGDRLEQSLANRLGMFSSLLMDLPEQVPLGRRRSTLKQGLKPSPLLPATEQGRLICFCQQPFKLMLNLLPGKWFGIGKSTSGWMLTAFNLHDAICSRKPAAN